jgi:hypothetical protein
MSIAKVYLYHTQQKVLVPSLGETTSGVFVEIAPLYAFSIHDLPGWQKQIRDTLFGDHTTSITEQTEEPGSLILEELGLNSWSEFEKQATLFTVHQGISYTTIYTTNHGADGMWSLQEMKERKFARKANLEYILEALEKEILCHPSPIKEKTPLLLSGPKL